jgi:hypothetical protein
VDAAEIVKVYQTETAAKWFSHFLLKAFVRRVKRLIPIRRLRLLPPRLTYKYGQDRGGPLQVQRLHWILPQESMTEFLHESESLKQRLVFFTAHDLHVRAISHNMFSLG